MTSENRIYPIFLPHAGCPFQCVYCNQNAVTSSSFGDSPLFSFQEQFRRLIEDAQQQNISGEIAFYGGTFTALPLPMLRDILESVSPWVRKGVFTGIRFSTRPDGISPPVCSFLKRYPVRTVELGVQSFSDKVLLKSCRGYKAETVHRAISLVKANGWSLGLQLMAGLPGDTRERFTDSVAEAIRVRPSLLRIYPTLVLQGTLLAQWYRQGIYRPLSLEEAIDWCTTAYDACLQADIPLARLGLHADPELEKPGTVLAGPHHPALGYLVRVRWWRNRIDEAIAGLGPISGPLTIRVPERSISEIIGPGRSNMIYWKNRWRLERIQIEREKDRAPQQFQVNIGC